MWQPLASLHWMLCRTVVKGLKPEAQRAESEAVVLGEGQQAAFHQLGALGIAVRSPSGAPEEVGFSVFWGFKHHQFLSTVVILTANFSDFAFALGTAIFN